MWHRLRADVLGRRITVVEGAEFAALGAARLAAVGAGWYPDAAAAAVPVTTRRIDPEPDAAARCERLYREVLLSLPDRLAPLSRALRADGPGAPT